MITTMLMDDKLNMHQKKQVVHAHGMTGMITWGVSTR